MLIDIIKDTLSRKKSDVLKANWNETSNKMTRSSDPFYPLRCFVFGLGGSKGWAHTKIGMLTETTEYHKLRISSWQQSITFVCKSD